MGGETGLTYEMGEVIRVREVCCMNKQHSHYINVYIVFSYCIVQMKIVPPACGPQVVQVAPYST